MRNPFQTTDNLSAASSWLSDFINSRNRASSSENRVLSAPKINDLIFRSFIHEDTEFQDQMEQTESEHPLFAELSNDIFTCLFSSEIKYNENLSIEAEANNRSIIEAIINSPCYGSLRKICEGKEMPAYEACRSLCTDVASNETLYPIFSFMSVVNLLEQQIDQMLERIHCLFALPPEKQLQYINRLFCKVKQAADLRKKIRDHMTAFHFSIGRNIQATLESALEKASQISNMLVTWGSGSGALQNTAENRELLQYIKGSRILQEISIHLGRYREILSSRRKNSYAFGLGEKYDLTTGHDISDCLSSELALLSVKETQPLFWRKQQLGQLLQHRRREPVYKGSGDIIIALDESSSTRFLQGWAKAFSLAMLDIAQKERRKFSLVHFASAEDILVNRFETGGYTSQDILAAAEHFFGGGTDFERPLEEIMQLISHGYEQADVVFITDGECEISHECAERFTEVKQRNRLTVTGILLDKKWICGHTLESFCDYIYHTRDFMEDEIALDILNRRTA